MVREDWNPKYYQLIKEFREYSGIGGILNTSFNLHGEPNVHTPNDALMTIENSGLQYLAIGKILIQKKP
jgi:carbamoyltransferase